MSLRFLRPPTSGWVESKLEKPHMDFLWKAIEITPQKKKENTTIKQKKLLLSILLGIAIIFLIPLKKTILRLNLFG